MKKFLVLLVVLAITGFASMAFAVDVTVGGSIQVRSRDFNDLNMGKEENAAYAGNQRDTQERIIIDVNAKADNVKGKISLWNDFDDWGRFEQVQGNNGFGNSTASTGGHFGIREAWLSFNLPGAPVNVTAGHQLLQLGNGWFFRSKHFGSDAWVVAVPTGNNTLAFVDVKVSEGAGTPTAPATVASNNVAFADDIDAYVILDVYKLGDMGTVGFDLTQARDRANGLGFAGAGKAAGNTIAYNLGLNYNGNLGPLALKAEADFQSGTVNSYLTGVEHDLKGMQIVLEGKLKASDALTINITAGRGTGNKTGDTDINRVVNFLDIDPHYTFLYEYKMPTATGLKNTGFSNTTAGGVGATFAVSKSLELGATYWYLTATQSTNVSGSLATAANGTTPANVIVPGGNSKALGQEVDVTVNWKIYDNLSWNWVLGYFAPGNAYKGFDTTNNVEVGKNAATGIQGILAFTF